MPWRRPQLTLGDMFRLLLLTGIICAPISWMYEADALRERERSLKQEYQELGDEIGSLEAGLEGVKNR